MDKKKLKLSISGDTKKTISNIEQAKSNPKNSIIINNRSHPKKKFNRPFQSDSFKKKPFSEDFKKKPLNFNPKIDISDFEKRKLAEQRATKRLKGEITKETKEKNLNKKRELMAYFEGAKMTAGYGDGPDIISSCSITANRGEIVAILGPNGAGKSTAMKAMLGLLKLKSGSVTLNGEDISKINPQDRVKKGISFVPQTRNVFAELTVRENLEIGGFLTEGSLENKIESIYSLFPILSEKKSQVVGQLSGGQRQQVALGRALMSDPSVLMLDEPTAGVSPIVMDELFEHIIKVKKTNVAVIMVEQNAKQALSISDRGYVLVTGQNKFEGSGNDLLEDPEVRRSFLGA